MSYCYPNEYEVIVVGGGNAGIEAAAACARMKAKTLLVTHNLDNLGQQSCNPSIGGIGKSHLVKEVDALDGLIAKATDFSGIQFRVLNASKGAAVRATRAQIDRRLYKYQMRTRIEAIENLSLIEEAVDALLLENGNVAGVYLRSGISIRAKAVVLCAGTFLNGKVFIGQTSYLAGRSGDPSSVNLGINLAELGLPKARLKTGTPARLDGRTIDFSKCEKQLGDSEPVPVFSYMGSPEDHPQQVPCWITDTNERTHDFIRKGLDRSPLFTGVIEGIGPRYCPSIEDKIHKFASKTSHHVFLEPEGLNTYEYYPNGISTSLPYDVQVNFIHSIKGLENVHIIRPGYAIEYDRLTEIGYKLGVVSEERWKFFQEKRERLARETERLKGIWVNPGVLDKFSLEEVVGAELSKESQLYVMLKRPEVDYQKLKLLKTKGGETLLPPPYLSDEEAETLTTKVKYSGYEDKQKAEVQKNLEKIETVISEDFDYDSAKGLSFEITQKLKKIKPRTLGEALNISGVTPAAISILLVYLKRYRGTKE